MGKLNKILNSVNKIIENSNNDVLTEISNISSILDVDKKTATVLHFVNKDSSWNPTALHMLEDISGKLSTEKQTLDLTPEKIKQKKDFYLLNYLNKTWSKRTIEHIKKYGKMSFF